VRVAQYVLSLSQDEFKHDFWFPDELDHDGKVWDPKAYHEQVRSWCCSIVQSAATTGDEEVVRSITYKFALNQKAGRLHVVSPDFGSQRLQARMRSLFVRGFVKDVDMKNAHPTLLLYLCKKFDIECTNLEAYVNNREAVLKKHNLNKQDVLVAINRDKPSKTSSVWFRNFQAEMVAMRDWFHENRSQFEGIVFGGNKKNPKASDLNRILSKLENEVLQVAISKVGPENVHTLMFDGFHLDNGAYNEDIVPMLNESTSKWGVKWAVKPMEVDVEIPSDFEFDYESWFENCVDYATVKSRLERNNARILEPACWVSRPDEDSDYDICNDKDFKHKTSHFVTEDKNGKRSSIHSEWIKDRTIRTYKDIDFVPDFDKCPPHTFNLFTGFPRRLTEETADVAVIHEHLREVISAGNQEFYEYMLNFEALKVQRPTETPRIAIVLKSQQQCGKDSLVDKWEHLFGSKHVYRTSDINDMVGNFNPSMKGKMIYQLNELTGKHGFANKEHVKDKITTARFAINDKFKHIIYQTNYITFVIASNNFAPVEVPWDDQRFVVNKISAIWKGNEDKWDAYHRAIRDPVTMDAYYTELMQRDISKFNPVRERPKTDAYRNMQRATIPEVFQVLNDAIENNDIGETWGHVVGDEWFITPTDFKYMYQSWVCDQGGCEKDYKWQLVLTKIRDIEGVRVDTKHRFPSIKNPANSYRFNLPLLKTFLSDVFHQEND